MELYRQSLFNNERNEEEELKKYLAKIVMRRFMPTMYIKLKVKEDPFFKIEGDEDTIMGLPIKKIKEYLNNYK